MQALPFHYQFSVSVFRFRFPFPFPFPFPLSVSVFSIGPVSYIVCVFDSAVSVVIIVEAFSYGFS